MARMAIDWDIACRWLAWDPLGAVGSGFEEAVVIIEVGTMIGVLSRPVFALLLPGLDSNVAFRLQGCKYQQEPGVQLLRQLYQGKLKDEAGARPCGRRRLESFPGSCARIVGFGVLVVC